LADNIASKDDFLKVTKGMEDRLTAKPKLEPIIKEPKKAEEPSSPSPQEDESISEADQKYADLIYGLPDGIEREEPQYRTPRVVGGLDPTLDLDPDKNVLQG